MYVVCGDVPEIQPDNKSTQDRLTKEKYHGTILLNDSESSTFLSLLETGGLTW
jgi:hypothetical protein